MPNIVGIVETAPFANQVISELLSAGLTKDDISLLMSDKTKAHFTAATKDQHDRSLADTAIGATAGGVLGALIAGLTMAGAVVIPGAALLIAGPVVSMLTGAGAGVAVGGLAGALSALGVSVTETRKYEREIKAGKAVIIAHTKNDAQTQIARSILMSEGAEIRVA